MHQVVFVPAHLGVDHDDAQLVLRRMLAQTAGAIHARSDVDQVRMGQIGIESLGCTLDVCSTLGHIDRLTGHLIARALCRRAHAPIPTAEALRDTLSSASAVIIIAVAVALVLIESERIVTVVVNVLRLRRRLTTSARDPPISGTGVVISIAVRCVARIRSGGARTVGRWRHHGGAPGGAGVGFRLRHHQPPPVLRRSPGNAQGIMTQCGETCTRWPSNKR